MKHPFWLVNSILFILLFIVGGILFFIPSSLPKKQSFIPEKDIKSTRVDLPKIDLGKIYINDLFGTYKAPPPKLIELEKEQPLPLPPAMQPTKMVSKSEPSFMPPLEITLKGIMVSENEKYNTVILEDNKTKLSKNYYIEDTIQDAQLIRITHNKVLLVRSNGQQETLYLNKHDAEIDQLLSQEQDWTAVVKKADTSMYHIDPQAFIKKVHSLAQFIDMLNLTTVYQRGESIGCRVGGSLKNSLGEALGLKTGDIVVKINDIPVTSTDKRYDIYKTVTNLDYDDTITMIITRKTIPFTLTYLLKDFEKEEIKEKKSQKSIQEKNPYNLEQEKMKVLEQKYKFAPSAQELKKQDKLTMLNASKAGQGKRRLNILTQPITSETHVGG